MVAGCTIVYINPAPSVLAGHGPNKQQKKIKEHVNATMSSSCDQPRGSQEGSETCECSEPDSGWTHLTPGSLPPQKASIQLEVQLHQHQNHQTPQQLVPLGHHSPQLACMYMDSHTHSTSPYYGLCNMCKCSLMQHIYCIIPNLQTNGKQYGSMV